MYGLQLLVRCVLVVSFGYSSTCDTTLKDMFRDDFDGTELHQKNWYVADANSTVYDELHRCRPDNIRVANGTLRITANHVGCERKTSLQKHEIWERSYAMNKFSFKYGEVEMRASVAHWKNSVVSGAFLISTYCAAAVSDCIDRWPPSITMLHGKRGDPYTIELEVDYLDGHPATARKDCKSMEDLSLAFHVYRLVWTESFLGWFIDGVEVFSVYNARWIPSEPMQLALMLDVEKHFPSNPFNESDNISATFLVDYVVVRQYLNDSAFVNQTKIAPRKPVLLPVLCTVIPAAVLLIIGISIVICVKHRRRQLSQGNMRKAYTAENIVAEYLSSTSCDAKRRTEVLNYVRALEVPLACIHATDIVLGQGEFGVVRKGAAVVSCCRSNPVEVAIKEPRDKTNPLHVHQLLEEIRVMSKAGRHLNICNLLGVVLKGETLLLLEFAKHGCLLKYLKHQRKDLYYNHTTTDGHLLPYDEMEAEKLQQTFEKELKSAKFDETLDKQTLCTRDLIDFTFQISRGMEYLNSRSIIHRDLAARNILVSEGRILKISDFGMAKQMSEYVMGQQYSSCAVSQCALPVRWMPPEAIVDKVFSEKSDVWSFGIVMWEIFSFGEVPYSSIRIDQGCVKDLVISMQNGEYLERPPTCPSFIYDLMVLCWQLQPQLRPDFSRLTQILEAALGNTTASTYIKLDSCCSHFNDMFKEYDDVAGRQTDVA